MELSQYIKENQPKGRYSKKYIKEHDKALFTAWYHIYVQNPNILLNQAKQIIKKK